MTAYEDALRQTRDDDGPVLVKVICVGDHPRRGEVVAAEVRRTEHGACFEARHPLRGAAADDVKRLTGEVRRQYRAAGREHELPDDFRVRLRHDQVSHGLSQVLLEWPRERRTVTVNGSMLHFADLDGPAFLELHAERDRLREHADALARRYDQLAADPTSDAQARTTALRAAIEAERQWRHFFADREVRTEGEMTAPDRMGAVAHCPRHGAITVDERPVLEAYRAALTSRPRRVLVTPS